MAFQEYTDERGSILYWTPPKSHQFNSAHVLGMDLDFTIIKPIKGKIFPVDKYDWQFIADLTSIQKHINPGGYKFVIFTNQAGLISKKTGNMDIDDFKSRWENDIYPKLKTDFQISSVYLIAALYDDFFRKPTTGMWDFMETHLNGDIQVNRKESIYIGDMAGRKGDHSYSDLMFAVNLGVSFKIPEEFYSGIAHITTTAKLTKNMMNDPKIFNPIKYLAELDKTTRKNLMENNKKVSSQITKILSDLETLYLIIYVGSPASGKSSFLKNYLDIKDTNLADNFIYMSQDKFPGTPAKFIKTISQNITIGKQHIIIDNTNGTRKTREKLIKLTHSGDNNYKTAVIYFNTPKDVVMHLNAIRTKENNACSLLRQYNSGIDCDDVHNVPAVAIHTYWKHFEMPDKDLEGFDEFYKVDFNPLDDNRHFKMLL